MAIYREIIFALWVLFIVVWIVGAFGAKKNVSGGGWWRAAGVRFVVIALIVLALRSPVVHDWLHDARHALVTSDPRLGLLGTILCALGVAFAIGARFYLGRNWGLPMSRKAAPELVTTGPYTYVRHPIYSGIMLAMLGSVIGESILVLLPLVIFGAYFVFSVRAEERILTEAFPDQYPAYRGRTKMLVPFVF